MALPSEKDCERVYGDDGRVMDALRIVREQLPLLSSHELRLKLVRDVQRNLWDDWVERFQMTTWIQVKKGPPQLLTMNWAQREFFDKVILGSIADGRPMWGIILKARQLGMSTLLQGLHYFWTNENPDRNALTISYHKDQTRELFRKQRYIHRRQWVERELRANRTNVLEFDDNDSQTLVQTAGADEAGVGFTLHHVHCSEIPLWRDPRSLISGMSPAIPDDNPECSHIWESTARGAAGLFYETWNRAVDGRSAYIPYFAPWHRHPTYRQEFRSGNDRNEFMRTMTSADVNYMRAYDLTPEQMKWREWITEAKLDNDRRRFRQEYPASPDEAFLTTGDPVFDPDLVQAMSKETAQPRWRGHIGMKVSA